MEPDHSAQIITLLMKQLEIVQSVYLPVTPEQSEQLIQKMRSITQTVQVEVNMASDHSTVGGDYVGGDKTGGDKVGGDNVRQSAGRDMQGVAGSRSSASSAYAYSGTQISTAEQFADELEKLADEVSASDVPAREKLQLLDSLYWFSEQAKGAETDGGPGDTVIEQKRGPLATAAGWIRERIGKVAVAVGTGVVAHWVVQALSSL